MKRAMAIFATTAALAFPVSAATIVQNGSFETGVPGNTTGLNNGQTYGTMPGVGGGWDRWTALDGWTTISGSGIEVQTNRTLGSIDAQDGNYYLEMDSNGNSSMAQDITLGVGRYLLEFFYSPRTGVASDNGISFGVNDLSGFPTVVSLLVGSVTGPSVSSGTAVGTWTKVSALFDVATAGSYQLTFEAIGTSNSIGGLIDNVSVSAVPVPAAGGLLLAAMGGLAALKRRRRA